MGPKIQRFHCTVDSSFDCKVLFIELYPDITTLCKVHGAAAYQVLSPCMYYIMSLSRVYHNDDPLPVTVDTGDLGHMSASW